MQSKDRSEVIDAGGPREGRVGVRWLLVPFVALLVAIAMAGCMSEDSALEMGEPTMPRPGIESPIQKAEAAMFDHDLARARALFAEARDYDPGRAAAGHAITSLLLLPFSPEAETLLVDHLGASSGVGDGSLLYGSPGLLYYLSLGTPWDDADGLVGIQTLLREEIPWSDEQLESPEAFVAGLSGSVNDLTDDLASVADALGRIEDDLKTALDEPGFRFLFVPGQVFHDDDLSLFLSRAELSAVHALVSAGRGVIYLLASYDHDFSLEQAFGGHWQQVIDDPAAHPDEFVEGWGYGDYVLDFLGGRLFRGIRSTIYLSQAGRSFQEAVHYLKATLEYGFGLRDDAGTAGGEGTLDWNMANPTTAAEIVELLDSVERSFDGPVEIPRALPATTMDLSVFFDEGRTLAPETPWLERVVVTDEFGDYVEWQLSDAAFRSFFIEGVFDPAFDPDDPPELQFTGDTDSFGADLTGDFARDVEDAYFSTR